MHDEALEDPQAFLEIAMELHSKMSLPSEELKDSPKDREWWFGNNDHLFDNAFYYASGEKEWWFCYGIDFEPMPCLQALVVRVPYLRSTVMTLKAT